MRHKGFWTQASFCEYIRLVKQPLWRSLAPLSEPASAASLGCPFRHLPRSKAARSAICWLVRGCTFKKRKKESRRASWMRLTLTQSVIDSRFRTGTNFPRIWALKPTLRDCIFYFYFFNQIYFNSFFFSPVEDSPGIWESSPRTGSI